MPNITDLMNKKEEEIFKESGLLSDSRMHINNIFGLHLQNKLQANL